VRRHFVWKGLAFLVIGTAVVAAMSFVVMSLWNTLIPRLFSGPVVTFWQAAGLFVLSRLLFGGLRPRGGHGWRHRGWRHRWGRMTQEERDRFRDGFARWNDMTHEERREFRGRLHGRFHCGRGAAAEDLAQPPESP
jgi:hypothetical protein